MLLFGSNINPFSSNYISEEYRYIKKLFSKKDNLHLVEMLQYLECNETINWRLDDILLIDLKASNEKKIIEKNKEAIYLNYKIFLSESNNIDKIQVDKLWNLKTLLMLGPEIEKKQREINYPILDKLANQTLSDIEITDEEIEVADKTCEIFEINKAEFISLLNAKSEPAIKLFISSKTFNEIKPEDIERVKKYYEYLNKTESKYDIEIPIKFLNDYNEYCLNHKKPLIGLFLNVGFPTMTSFPLYGAYNCYVGKKKKTQGQASYEQNPARLYNYGVGLIAAFKYQSLASFTGERVSFVITEIKEFGESQFTNTGETFLYILKKGERNSYGISNFEIENHRLLLKNLIDQFNTKTEIIEKDNISYSEKPQDEEKIVEPEKDISDIDKDPQDYLKELNKMVGLDVVKSEINSLTNFIKVQNLRKSKNLKTAEINLHTVFIGPPGTGKTTVARLYGGVLKQLGMLKKGHLIEVDRSGLVAGYLGQTALKVDEVVKQALDGILFIDEAYSLVGSENDSYGSEAVDVLLKKMEDNRDRLVIILAGYKDEMNHFIDSNPGLQSRFNRYIKFEDYTQTELLSIFKLMCLQNQYNMEDESEKFLINYFDETLKRESKNLGNGRFVRNIFEKIIQCHSNRIVNIDAPSEEQMTTFSVEDIKNAL